MTLPKVKTRLFKAILQKPNQFRQKVNYLRYLTSECNPVKWVFIVGCYNSGTTLLGKLLSQHKNISYLDEGAHYTDELKIPDELGWPRMWCEVEDDIKKDIDNVDSARNLRKDWSWLFDVDKNVYLEKSISNTARVEWLKKNFSNSYFVHIIRNGYAVAEGIRVKAPNDNWNMPDEYDTYPISKCAKMWCRSAEVFKSQAKSISNTKTVAYEKLCKSPKKVVSEIWKFIGINAKPTWDESTSWTIHGNTSPIQNMNDKRLKHLSCTDRLSIKRQAHWALEKYNYL
jgi:adenylate kinase family enzyme